MSEKETTIHQGRNVKRFREMFGLKQEALAYELGDDWTQKRVSVLEQKETIDPQLLEKVAGVLKIPVEAIKNFDEEAAISYINTFNDSSEGNFNYHCNFNPLDKYIEQVEENKKLYERLLQAEREKNDLLQQMLNKQ